MSKGMNITPELLGALPNAAAEHLLRARLGEAIRRVGAAYRRCQDTPDVNDEEWLVLEAEIDAAFAAADPDAALNAIRAWERHAIKALGVADGG